MADNKFNTPSRAWLMESAQKRYKNLVDQGLTQITDIGEGSEINILLNSIMVELESAYKHDALLCDQRFITTAEGYFLDLHACENHLSRHVGRHATGEVTFKLKNGTRTKNLTIPQNTIIKNRTTGYDYRLTHNVVIVAGTLSSTGMIEAVNPGYKYNVEQIDQLTAFDEIIQDTMGVGVTNHTKILGGSDMETDAELRDRILKARQNHKCGTLGWYSAQLGQIDNVHDVAFVNPENVQHYINNQRCTDCSRVIYVNGNTKPCDDNIINNIMFYINNQNNIQIGHKFHVEKAIPRPFYLEINAYDYFTPTEAELVYCLSSLFDGGTVTSEFTASGQPETFPGYNLGDSVHSLEIINALEKLNSIEQVDSVYELKYNGSIGLNSVSIEHWQPIDGTNRYQYVSPDGYTYSAWYLGKGEHEFFCPWGRRNLTITGVKDSEVAQLGDMYTKEGSPDVRKCELQEGDTSRSYDTMNYRMIRYNSLGRAKRT